MAASLTVPHGVTVLRLTRPRAHLLGLCRRLSSTAGPKDLDGSSGAPPPATTTTGRSTEGSGAGPGDRLQRISKAMKSYLDNAKKREEFMREKEAEWELGKRHLANIMGWDVNRITQEDIDSAIRYLLPSGLFQVRARPLMKPPDQVYPRVKAAMFGFDGRPNHYLFYTGKPLFNQILADIHAAFLQLNKFEDSMIANGILVPPPEARIDLAGTEWLKFAQLESLLMERITEKEYDYMIQCFERLAQHPYSARVKDLFLKLRQEMVAVTTSMDFAPLTYDEDSDRPYAEAEGLRKHCVAAVKVIGKGTGRICVNGQDLRYWQHLYQREQVLFPLLFSGMLGKVDVEATVRGVGESAQAGAVRHGISLALRPFLPPDMVEAMRLAGLLTKDRRVHERKKPGQWAARRKFTWLKR